MPPEELREAEERAAHAEHLSEEQRDYHYTRQGHGERKVRIAAGVARGHGDRTRGGPGAAPRVLYRLRRGEALGSPDHIDRLLQPVAAVLLPRIFLRSGQRDLLRAA